MQFSDSIHLLVDLDTSRRFGEFLLLVDKLPLDLKSNGLLENELGKD
jgi:hypothetical protein